MVAKPDWIFDRVSEWDALADFAATGRSGRPGATLGVVSGRRRQGKSFLLQALAEATGGMYFAATEATEAESLRLFAAAVARHTGSVPEIPFRDWNDAIAYLFTAFRDRREVAIIDEFPFLTRMSPALPSIIQRELGPGGSGSASQARMILCGSAMAVMGKILAGHAPLRGRAGLELVIQPFDYRQAARFWGIQDPRLAIRLHAIVGGTPAYRHEFTRGESPASLAGFDQWVIRNVLDRRTPMFREARYLLAEESDIREPGIYHSVLAAITHGSTTSSAIASFIGRKADQITHPLNVLEDAALIRRQRDVFRAGRTRYRIVEPLIVFYEAIMRRRWPELELGRAKQVWDSSRAIFQSQVMGPQFEAVCRDFAGRSGQALFGDHPAEVGSGVVNDAKERTQIEVDVAVFAPQKPGKPARVLSLGEAKWGETMDGRHVNRLARARDLLTAAGYDTSQTVLACYSAAGFADGMTDGGDVRLVGLDQLYEGDLP
ncbi:MAG TPA: ATP-binding protein [Micromonosporaceae bacterium]|jgi:hypothetical protein